MKPSINKLIEIASDFDLCDAVYMKIANKFNNIIQVEEYSTEERVVVLVWHSTGIIGNGGFHYLFEGDYPGDPGFKRTLKAYEILGVKRAVRAFKKALAIFPNSRPPEDIEKRLEILLRIPYEPRREKIDLLFFSADEETTQKLAQYIRDHADAFRPLWQRIPIQKKRTTAKKRATKKERTIKKKPMSCSGPARFRTSCGNFKWR